MLSPRPRTHLLLVTCLVGGAFLSCTPSSGEPGPAPAPPAAGSGGGGGSGGSPGPGSAGSGGSATAAAAARPPAAAAAAPRVAAAAARARAARAAPAPMPRPRGAGGPRDGAGGPDGAPGASPAAFPPGPHKVVLITGDDANIDDPSRLQMIEILKSMKDTHEHRHRGDRRLAAVRAAN